MAGWVSQCRRHSQQGPGRRGSALPGANDSINRRMGKVGKNLGTLSLPAALASGPDSVVSLECSSFTCVPASWGVGLGMQSAVS